MAAGLEATRDMVQVSVLRSRSLKFAGRGAMKTDL